MAASPDHKGASSSGPVPPVTDLLHAALGRLVEQSAALSNVDMTFVARDMRGWLSTQPLPRKDTTALLNVITQRVQDQPSGFNPEVRCQARRMHVHGAGQTDRQGGTTAMLSSGRQADTGHELNLTVQGTLIETQYALGGCDRESGMHVQNKLGLPLTRLPPQATSTFKRSPAVQALCILVDRLNKLRSLTLPAQLAVAVHADRAGLVQQLNLRSLGTLLSGISGVALPAHLLDACAMRATQLLTTAMSLPKPVTVDVAPVSFLGLQMARARALARAPPTQASTCCCDATARFMRGQCVALLANEDALLAMTNSMTSPGLEVCFTLSWQDALS